MKRITGITATARARRSHSRYFIEPCRWAEPPRSPGMPPARRDGGDHVTGAMIPEPGIPVADFRPAGVLVTGRGPQTGTGMISAREPGQAVRPVLLGRLGRDQVPRSRCPAYGGCRAGCRGGRACRLRARHDRAGCRRRRDRARAQTVDQGRAMRRSLSQRMPIRQAVAAGRAAAGKEWIETIAGSRPSAISWSSMDLIARWPGGGAGVEPTLDPQSAVRFPGTIVPS